MTVLQQHGFWINSYSDDGMKLCRDLREREGDEKKEKECEFSSAMQNGCHMSSRTETVGSINPGNLLSIYLETRGSSKQLPNTVERQHLHVVDSVYSLGPSPPGGNGREEDGQGPDL